MGRRWKLGGALAIVGGHRGAFEKDLDVGVLEVIFATVSWRVWVRIAAPNKKALAKNETPVERSIGHRAPRQPKGSRNLGALKGPPANP